MITVFKLNHSSFTKLLETSLVSAKVFHLRIGDTHYYIVRAEETTWFVTKSNVALNSFKLLDKPTVSYVHDTLDTEEVYFVKEEDKTLTDILMELEVQ